MALYNFHRVLIAAAILFFLGLAVFGFWRHSREAEPGLLAMGVGGAIATIVAIAYFIYFNIRLRRLRLSGEVR